MTKQVVKKPYVAPKLVSLGTVESLTRQTHYGLGVDSFVGQYHSVHGHLS